LVGRAVSRLTCGIRSSHHGELYGVLGPSRVARTHVRLLVLRRRKWTRTLLDNVEALKFRDKAKIRRTLPQLLVFLIAGVGFAACGGDATTAETSGARGIAELGELPTPDGSEPEIRQLNQAATRGLAGATGSGSALIEYPSFNRFGRLAKAYGFARSCIRNYG